VVLAVMMVPLLPTTASAGGSWLELRRIEGTGGVSDGAWGGWASAGSSVFMRGDFCTGQQDDPSAGPWTAYLRRDPSGQRQPLGPVAIQPATGNGCPFSASVTFVVPDVETGMYWVDICADTRCATGVGDLIGATFAVATTRLEAKALTVLPDVKARLQQERRHRHRLQERIDSLRDELKTVSNGGGSVTEVPGSGDGATPWRTVALASLFALGAALAGLATALVRGRRRSVHVPDTPADLLEPAERR
jgi:hypothetical protein